MSLKEKSMSDVEVESQPLQTTVQVARTTATPVTGREVVFEADDVGVD